MDAVEAKLRRLIDLLQHELAVRELGQKITTETDERMTKAQREYFLREQLRSIQRELGEEDGGGQPVAELRRQIEEAGLPEEARREAERELARLATVPPASPEHGIIRTYLEWMASLPWSKLAGGGHRRPPGPRGAGRGPLRPGEDQGPDPRVPRGQEAAPGARPSGRARRATAGRPTPAEPPARDAATRPRGSRSSASSGPPGVGKTSLGQSIARALGRKFVRMSLGGVHDEAEIRGHRRTYIGALPGRIIQALRRAETRDPVFMLDEIDKVGADWRGDPSSALLEVLDPAQNHTFVDNYLGVAFDLSQVLFIATANTLDTIPGPLRDRMEVLPLSGYTDEEKVEIARQYLVPKQLAAHGLRHGRARLRARGPPRRSCGATRARRASGTSTGRSPPSPGRWPAGSPRASPSRSRSPRTTWSSTSGGRASSTRSPSGRPARRGDGPGLDPDRRRRPVRRGHHDARAATSG